MGQWALHGHVYAGGGKRRMRGEVEVTINVQGVLVQLRIFFHDGIEASGRRIHMHPPFCWNLPCIIQVHTGVWYTRTGISLRQKGVLATNSQPYGYSNSSLHVQYKVRMLFITAGELEPVHTHLVPALSLPFHILLDPSTLRS